MISTVSSQTVLKMTENASHFPPSPLFFVYVEKTFIHKNAKSVWWILLNWFPDLSNNFVSYFSLAHRVSGVTNANEAAKWSSSVSISVGTSIPVYSG